MTVLIVTFSHDNESIPLVIKAIETMGKKAFRFVEDFRIIKILNPKSNQDSQSQIIKEIYDRFNCYF
ncbi:hypothetical protein D3800_22525 [Microcystis aeruginosa NIES-298]|uniref:MvdD-like pre-ATP grasp domain-containing protein n=1 Tax=Microcystis aeruginosa NIES-298 TaxID=449468 RepID=A0A2H6BLN9_MICAE|nr:hypothetical protein [Microcystis aeruginosa]QHU85805.1 hypothetical protein D3800_22510 [Microcystis aeruginosa NIES-298]QHU85806.1 hypothetical protein D3800_22515 [Microcystis aeruginosa NIES-298]QHU85807.1 hypothetical protein D3800_22520 [Microcystis aeruginosa NIES-298]QHU85808.1 hypothetical protein D3800_22525 [Microcystis aeruginosa NIES-298]GBD51092.1 hypothetical protein BGM30_01850 [Microcystis aeruginosa NIES-298]